MLVYNKLYKMNTAFGIWRYSKRLRITYVSQGWFVVWDHRETPPKRYDCHKINDHHGACVAVIKTIYELVLH